ncbi:MAG: class I SAM-dependent methyltransferase [Prochlorococcaceae cyanobacterium]
MTSISLDLGCGTNPQNPFDADLVFGIDSMRTASPDGRLVEVRKADLAVESIPFATAMFDFVTAYDFIEHIPRIVYLHSGPRCSFVELMNEVFRVLRPGGTFFSLTPAYPSPKAFQDPTHVNIITESTFPNYFCGDSPWARAYGFTGFFSLESQEWVEGSHLSCLMRKRT